MVDRLSPGDSSSLALDRLSPPPHVAVLLDLGRADGADGAFVAEVAARLATVPRLRQVVVPAPFLGGGPYWAPAPGFRPERQVDVVSVGAGDGSLSAAACAAALARFPRGRPAWRARLIRQPGGRRSLVVVLHHVVTDGVGGLEMLAALDDRAYRVTAAGPQPVRPTRRQLRVDAWSRRRAAAARLPQRGRAIVSGARELGLDARPPILDRSYLNQPTGATRRLAWTVADLDGVLAVSRRLGATLNDVVVAVIAGELGAAMHRNGERPTHVVVSVPVAVRRRQVGPANAVGVMPVDVPLLPDLRDRIAAVGRITSARKSGGRGSSAGVASLMGRPLAALGVLGWTMQHQRLVTTLVSSLRGPAVPYVLAGRTVERAIPFSVSAGNLGLLFLTFSYAGTLGISVLADPTTVPDFEDVCSGIGRTLSQFTLA